MFGLKKLFCGRKRCSEVVVIGVVMVVVLNMRKLWNFIVVIWLVR